MLRRVVVLVLLFLAVVTQFARAEDEKFLQLAAFNPVQLVPEDESVKGVSLGALYAVNRNVYGLSLCIGVNRATNDMGGVQIALGNVVEGSAYGGQMGIINYTGKRFVGVEYGMANIVGGDMTGVQWGIVNWTEGFMHGIQYGTLNYSRGEAVGIDIGVVNFNGGSFRGVQGGFINYSGEMHGLQLGLINYTKSLDGVQIGLGNYNGNKDPMEFMVLVNWSF